MSNGPPPPSNRMDPPAAPTLIDALNALDRLLACAVAQADLALGAASADPFRGLHLGSDDIARELARHPCEPKYAVSCEDLFHAVSGADSPFGAMTRAFGLTVLERACLLLALAPEIDLRYERLCAYLQDDVTRKRPTVALALDLFCANLGERDRLRRLLAPDGTLFRERLVERAPDGGASRLAAPLILDAQILKFLLGEDGIDGRLGAWCSLRTAEDRAAPPALSERELGALVDLAEDAARRAKPFVACFSGAHGTGKRAAAQALAARLGRPLLTIDLRGALQSGDFADAVRLALRAASLNGAVALLHGHDALAAGGERQALRALSDALALGSCIVVVACTGSWRDAAATPLPIVTLDFDRHDLHTRRTAWAFSLATRHVELAPESVTHLAERFRLTPAQIDAAVASAQCEREWRARQQDTPDVVSVVELTRAARYQCGHALAALARRIVPRRTWDDLVLPPESLRMLHEICARVTHRARVLDDWGFEAQLTLGTGIAALFAGPSGTGKTLAAEVVAADLGLDVFQIDLANVVSKYIGETEKNLDRIFEAARNANAVLLFDEAEALFGKRSEVRDAHDRYANLEIAYLLQKMEAFEGLAILSTNMRQNIDDAFTRRLTFTVHFPFPEEGDRRRIWEIIWPAKVPRAVDVDAGFLARELMLSGGNIRNAALAAAFYAAADGSVVTRAHVLQAARREFQKMGKVFAAAEAAR